MADDVFDDWGVAAISTRAVVWTVGDGQLNGSGRRNRRAKVWLEGALRRRMGGGDILPLGTRLCRLCWWWENSLRLLSTTKRGGIHLFSCGQATHYTATGTHCLWTPWCIGNQARELQCPGGLDICRCTFSPIPALLAHTRRLTVFTCQAAVGEERDRAESEAPACLLPSGGCP